jgi:long-chain acyl-CoA synthetase
MRIEDHLRESARRFGTKTALITAETQLTFGELDALSDRLAESLVQHGLGEGDRLLIVAENSAEVVVAFFAAWKAGAIPCPLYSSIKADKLRAIVAKTEPKAILAQGRFVPVVDAALGETDTAIRKIAFF